MSLKSISVVIPNYNGRKFILTNIQAAINALEKAGAEYEIIIADDASTDDSVSLIRSLFPEAIILQNEKNLGFSPTINKGIRRAGKELVLALNSDVQLTNDYFHPLFKYFEKKSTFGVMGRIINMHDDEIQDGAKFPGTKGSKFKTTVNYLPGIMPSEKDNFIPSFFLSGANALMDREKLQELGGFDEIFAPFYAEDADLSLRAWRLGWKCYYEHAAICRHPASTTINAFNKRKKVRVIALCNRMILHRIHLEGREFLLWRTELLSELILKWAMLRFEIYPAFLKYVTKRKEIRKSIRKFRELQQKYPAARPLKAVIRELNSEISTLSPIKF